ncbi:MAG TPA: hypothetical protein VFA18_12835 [Gemmataceae bacterium]|nr:hypothetical protein [Gemmataceae bacterium]
MESLFQFVAPPTPCGYLHDQFWGLEYEIVAAMTPAEYLDRMGKGWRRFGDTLFRPRCQGCQACRSLRILVERFRPTAASAARGRPLSLARCYRLVTLLIPSFEYCFPSDFSRLPARP